MRPEYVNVAAIIVAWASFAMGFVAVGRKGRWDFGNGLGPYLAGNSRALLYALLIVTMIMSLIHAMLLTDWLLVDLAIKSPLGIVRRYSWMVWHLSIEMALAGLHCWIWRHRVDRYGQPDRYFWNREALRDKIRTALRRLGWPDANSP